MLREETDMKIVRTQEKLLDYGQYLEIHYNVPRLKFQEWLAAQDVWFFYLQDTIHVVKHMLSSAL